MDGEKKRRRLRRSRYLAATLNPNQFSSTTQSQKSLDQPYISRPTDTDRNLDLDLRQSGNRQRSRSPQRPSFRSATPPQKGDGPTRIRSTLPPPPPPHNSQAASTVTPPSAQTMTISILLSIVLGGMTKTCQCQAKLWPTETPSLCCANGQVNFPPLQTLPEPLHHLFAGDTAESRQITFTIQLLLLITLCK